LNMYITYHTNDNRHNFEWNGKSYYTKQDALNAIDNFYPGGVIDEKSHSNTNGITYYYVDVCVESGATTIKAKKTTQHPPRPARYSDESYSNKNIGDTINFGIPIPYP
uniref:Astacin domain-containing protein n=1 Tax=Parastrongyloides trichosuri TaxID=131310 RepID=A0A0N4Z2V5_PARTI